MAEKKKYSGVEKAAILMLAVGDELASEVMRRLDDREIHSVGNYMTFMGSLPSEDMNEVAREFFEMVQSGEGGMVAGGKDYVKKNPGKITGPEQGERGDGPFVPSRRGGYGRRIGKHKLVIRLCGVKGGQ